MDTTKVISTAGDPFGGYTRLIECACGLVFRAVGRNLRCPVCGQDNALGEETRPLDSGGKVK